MTFRGPRIYLAIGLLSLLASALTARNLVATPAQDWQPIDVTQTLIGFVMFGFLSWFGLTGTGSRAAGGRRPARGPLPAFFIPALLVGLAIGAGSAYWQGTAMGWSAGSAATLAIATTGISGVAILIVLKLVRR